MSDFTDRFTASTLYTNDDAQQMSEQQLLSNFPELVVMERMVRNHSVLLRSQSNVPLIRIYNTITQHSDPRIALYMAGAKNRDNTHYFVGLDKIRNLMFGESDPTPNVNQTLFKDGIRRVSAALAASVLIGELSQIEQQFQHSKLLEEQALADLRAIVETYAVSSSSSSTENEVAVEATFYFKPEVIGTDFKVEFYLPSIPYLGWQLVNNYTSPTLVSTVVGDLADAINEACLSHTSSNLLASASLSDSTNLYRLSFQARSIVPELYSEVVSVRITSNVDPTYSPITWGNNSSVLKNEILNSLIITIKNAKVLSGSGSSPLDKVDELCVIYFKKTSGPTYTNSSLLRYRVLAHTELLTDVTIPYLTDLDPQVQQDLDFSRHAQTAEALAQDLATHRQETKVVAAIIRSDPVGVFDAPLTAVMPVAFSPNNPYVSYVLDILELPPDVEIALGNHIKPLTSFSRRQRSIKIPIKVLSTSNSGSIFLDKSKVAKTKQLNIKNLIEEEESYITYVRYLQ